MRISVLLSALMLTFSSLAHEPKAKLNITIKQVRETAELNTFARTIANLVEVYYPELLHTLKGKQTEGRKAFTISFGTTEKSKPVFFEQGELKVNLNYFKSVKTTISGSAEQFGALWTTHYPEDVNKVLRTLVREIIHYKNADLTIKAVNSYISQRFTFNSNNPKIIPDEIKKPFTIASFWRFMEKRSNQSLVSAALKQPGKFSPQSNPVLYKAFKEFVLSRQDKQIWYPVTVTYSEAPDMERFALRNKKYTETYYDTLITQLDSEQFKPYKNVKIRIREGRGVAATGGNNISYAAPFYRSNPDDYGSIVHELTHVVQQSPHYDPVWLIEATADYMRYYHGYRGDIRETPGGHFTRGYRYVADFLRYIEKNYKIKTFIKDLNVEVRKSSFHVPFDRNSYESRMKAKAEQLKRIDNYLGKLTGGKTTTQLWDEYQQWLLKPNRELLWENQGQFGVSLSELEQ